MQCLHKINFRTNSRRKSSFVDYKVREFYWNYLDFTTVPFFVNTILELCTQQVLYFLAFTTTISSKSTREPILLCEYQNQKFNGRAPKSGAFFILRRL